MASDKWASDRHETIARGADLSDPTKAVGNIAISIGQQLRTLAISFECWGEMMRQVAAEQEASDGE